MSNLLRRPPRLGSLQRCIRAYSHPRSLALRPTSIPRHLFARHCARSYSAGPGGDPRNSSDDASRKQPKGMEHLYSSNSPLSKSPQGSSRLHTSSEPTSKLSPEEEKEIKEAVAWLKKTAPPGLKLDKDLDQILVVLKKNGLSGEYRQLLTKFNKGNITPALVIKLLRMTTDIAKQVATSAQQSDSGATTGPQQKSGAHDPGPDPVFGASSTSGGGNKSDSKKNSQQGGGMSTNDIIFNVAVTVIGASLFHYFTSGGSASTEVSWQDFRNNMLSKGLVEKLVVHDNTKVRIYLNREAYSEINPESPVARNPNFQHYFTIGSVETFERKLDEAQRELGIPTSESIPVQYVREPGSWIPTVLTIAVNVGFLYLFFSMRRGMTGGAGGGGGIFGMGKSRAKKFNHETDIKVKFADVAGMDEAKEEIMEFVKFLKDPGHYQKLGAKIPRGAILSGPPGTGKTLLAKATAGESGVPFFSVSGSEFVEMFVGVGASRVRDLFANARKNTPCIIFIDEIDAIGRSRSKNNLGGGNDEREATLNQILTEMDGFNTSDQVVVLAGTNRRDVLDSALLRPGRFDRHIDIDKPTMEGRKQIFRVHLKNIITKLNLDDIDGRLAALTPGFSGADIANCVNEAALIAARDTAAAVDMKHFEQAIERVIGGLEKKSLVLSPEEKRVVAYHEAGHAICGWYFKYADPLLKVSIIPRGQGALGYAQYLPAGDTFLMNVKQMMDRMAMTLAGRVSEELHFDTVTSGASDDFNKVTRMSRAMVTRFGMSEKIGHLCYDEDGQQSFQKPYSEAKAAEIDEEVRRIVSEAYKQCKDLLVEKKREIGLVAEALLKKEMLTRDDLIEILGPRPFEEKGDFSKYFGSRGDRNGLGGGFDVGPTEKQFPPPSLDPGNVGPAPAICDGKEKGV